MDFSARYERNRSSILPEEQEKLAASKVLVLGCGGLGGYIIETLARIGVGHLTVVDGDVFQPSNLNRQLLSTENNMGKSKAQIAKLRVGEINSSVEVEAVEAFADGENIASLISGKDLVIDALDNADARLLTADAAAQQAVVLVHGAISGWTARVHTVCPGDESMHFLCGENVPNPAGNLPFTALMCAAIEAAEAVKVLLGKGVTTESKLLEIDLRNLTFDTVELW